MSEMEVLGEMERILAGVDASDVTDFLKDHLSTGLSAATEIVVAKQVKAADTKLADAETDYELALSKGDKTKIATAEAAKNTAYTAAGKAATGMTETQTQARAASAQAEAQKAINEARAKPTDAWWQARARAWSKVAAWIAPAMSTALVQQMPTVPPPNAGSVLDLLQKKVIGPIPVWGIGLAAVIGGIWWYKRKTA